MDDDAGTCPQAPRTNWIARVGERACLMQFFFKRLTLPNMRPLTVEMCGDLFPRGMMLLRTHLWREAFFSRVPRLT